MIMTITEEEITLLREWIQEPISEEWNDDRLDTMFVIMGEDLEATAASIWRGKASAAASLVDVSENGSSRKLGDIQGKYLKIAEDFEKLILERTEARTSRPYTNAIVRP
jgi:hypothetical protein